MAGMEDGGGNSLMGANPYAAWRIWRAAQAWIEICASSQRQFSPTARSPTRPQVDGVPMIEMRSRDETKSMTATVTRMIRIRKATCCHSLIWISS
jgi:hypothetical protein